MSEEVKEVPNNARRNFFKYAGLGAAGLLLGGYTGASWRNGAPLLPHSISSGAFDISQGKVTRWQRYPSLFKYEEIPDSRQSVDVPWEQVELDAPMRAISQNVWMTDIDITNTGDNMLATLEGLYGGEDYHFNYDKELVPSMPYLLIELGWVGMLLNRQPHEKTVLDDVTYPRSQDVMQYFPYEQNLRQREDLDDKYQVIHRGMFSREGNVDSNGVSYHPGTGEVQDVFEIENVEIKQGTTTCTLVVGGNLFQDVENVDMQYYSIGKTIYAKETPLIQLGKVEYSLRQVAG